MLPQNCEIKTSSIIDSSIRKKLGFETQVMSEGWNDFKAQMGFKKGIDINTYNASTPLKFTNVPSAMLTRAFLYRSLLENEPRKDVMSTFF